MSKKFLTIILLAASLGFIPTAEAENTLMVVFKLSSLAQTNPDLRQRERMLNSLPFKADWLQQLSLTAKVKLQDIGPLAVGGRLLQSDHQLTHQEMNEVLQRLNQLSCCTTLAYAERNISYATPQTTTPTLNPPFFQVSTTQWNLMPKLTYSAPSRYCDQTTIHGNNFVISNLGRSFTPTFSIPATTGKGSVVAVLDGGYTANPALPLSIYVPLKSVASGKSLCPKPGSASCSYGYTFLDDCRQIGSCPLTTPAGPKVMANPAPNGLDLGSGNPAYQYTFADGTNTNIAETPTIWHGSNIISQISAQQYMVGAAPAARILPVRITGRGAVNGQSATKFKFSNFSLALLSNAILWAAGLYAGPEIKAIPQTPARVINMSIILDTEQPTCPQALQDAIDEVIKHGVTVVAAAGNLGVNTALYSPANCNGVINVTATNSAGNLSYYSNFGDKVTIASAGGEVSTQEKCSIIGATCSDLIENVHCKPGATFNSTIQNYFKDETGTSTAAAIVSAAVASAVAIDPSLTPQQITTLLQTTGDKFASSAARCLPQFDANANASPDFSKCVKPNVTILNTQALLAKVTANLKAKQVKQH